MLKSNELTDFLIEHDFLFATGVPDSVFKDFLIDLLSRKSLSHIISNNEGESCSIAAGYHLGTGKVPVVYMQNSGLGNAINPLTSLLDSYIYSIPVLLLITWRGAPGKVDEPQHKRMGEILLPLLDTLNIPYKLASGNKEDINLIFLEAKKHFLENKRPYAIVFKSDVFEPEKKDQENSVVSTFTREFVLNQITKNLTKNDVIITTTGKTSRELFEVRAANNQSHQQDFLTVGSMGCASSIGLGVAHVQPNRKVVVVDGDGACLMRMEAMATIGYYQPKNYLHIIIDNNAYESTGSQQTLSHKIDFSLIAKACSYKETKVIMNSGELQDALDNFVIGPSLFVVKIQPYSRNNLGRPSTTPKENKQAFMDFILNKQEK